jgi:hypothetical protein
MKALVFKILRGSYPEIPKSYSEELRMAISEMLSKNPADRPSMKKILEKDFLAVPLSYLFFFFTSLFEININRSISQLK